MKWFTGLSSALLCLSAVAVQTQSTQGLYDLVARRMPDHVGKISFSIAASTSNSVALNGSKSQSNDEYTVTASNGTVAIEGTTLSALASGLHRYLTDVAHVDIYWYTPSTLNLAPTPLPRTAAPLKGSSVVPWRYHFNTVTFSYTSAFWSWADWELELDWLALRGVNLPLAWVGFEKIYIEVFQELGLTSDEIFDFLSGPAFQSWNRFGNIQDSWGGQLPQAWVDGQFALQVQILQRMVSLGMTPVLPAFAGFVPRAFPRVFPNASVVNGSQWNAFPLTYTNDTFLQPEDPLFTTLQVKIIQKQLSYYGNITHIFTLDQYNENDPASGDAAYLKNVTYNTWKSLKAADPEAIWMIQGWLFFSNSDFWSNDRVEAYLSGVEEDSDMLILDLFSETQPQWQRLNSYYGKPWIWCQLHDYGGNVGLYGQVENVTINPIEALANSTSTMVGMGLTMEGQEGNEIMYDLLLDQAWSGSPIDTATYFHNWVTTRYSSHSSNQTIPPSIYNTWNTLRTTVYNNTKLTAAQAVTKSIFELAPNATGLINRTGHHPTEIMYDPGTLTSAWRQFLSAANSSSTSWLWQNDNYVFDVVDMTRQVLSNAFQPLYLQFVAQTNLTLIGATNSTSAATSTGHNTTSSLVSTANQTATSLLTLLTDLDTILQYNPSIAPSASLPNWISAAQSWAAMGSSNSSSNTSLSSFYTYNALNQITLWGPTGQISDYASRPWYGLVGTYYHERWRIFTNAYLDSLRSGQKVNQTALAKQLLTWEEGWVASGGGYNGTSATSRPGSGMTAPNGTASSGGILAGLNAGLVGASANLAAVSQSSMRAGGGSGLKVVVDAVVRSWGHKL